MTIIVDDSIIRLERLELGPFGTNAYIVSCPAVQESLLVDAPAEPKVIIDRLGSASLKYILLTHNHLDHIGALAQLRAELEVPLAAHSADGSTLTPLPEILLNDGDVIRLGELEFAVLHTPGHTPGSLCFKVGPYLISGDTIFPGGPGKTGSPDAFRQIIKSISEKILVLPDDTQIYPGHGDPTVVKKEKGEFAAFASRSRAQDLHGDVLWLGS
jgi:hydroxyacylglutathione hydrolase